LYYKNFISCDRRKPIKQRTVVRRKGRRAGCVIYRQRMQYVVTVTLGPTVISVISEITGECRTKSTIFSISSSLVGVDDDCAVAH